MENDDLDFRLRKMCYEAIIKALPDETPFVARYPYVGFSVVLVEDIDVQPTIDKYRDHPGIEAFIMDGSLFVVLRD